MRNFDSAVLRAGAHLSALSGHLVLLLEQLTHRLSCERDAASANGELDRRIDADLLSALELQKKVVEEHFALVNSMLRRQSRRRHLVAAQAAETETQALPKPPGRPRRRIAATGATSVPKPVESYGHSFTERQHQIIQLVSLGYDNKQISESLCIAEQTVKNHLHTIFEKAGVSRRRELAVLGSNNLPDSEGVLDGYLSRQRDLQ
jgi:ATP/maltotriose-dependent transcriptional regulator MalT